MARTKTTATKTHHAKATTKKQTATAKRTAKLDLRKRLGTLYAPDSSEPSFVEVPPIRFLMIDGEGDPNTAPAYRAAIQALYAVAYALKFLVRAHGGPEYTMMPLEGLWWADDMTRFANAHGDKSGWKWTMMIAQPEAVTPALFEKARRSVGEKKGLAAAAALRLETFREGPAAQILYTGAYSGEGPTIETLHRAIAARGGKVTGKHHEIYLNAPGRTPPERLRTIIRQPFAPT